MKGLRNSRFYSLGLFLLLPIFALAQEFSAPYPPLATYRDGQVFIVYEKNPHWLMFQDSMGLLWGFDRNNHLIRFDGKEVEVFTPDPNDLTSVQCISPAYYFLQDQDGKIWISLNECGLERYDPETGRFDHYAEKFKATDGFTPGYFHNLFQTSDGTILVGAQSGMHVFSEEDGLFHKLGSGHQGRPLYEDDQGNIEVFYTFSNEGLLQQFDQNWTPVTDMITLPDHQFPETDDNDNWLELLAAYPITNSTKEYSANLIFHEYGNLFTYNTSTNEARNYTHLLNEDEWTSGLYVEGNTILVGTNQGRLLQFHPEEERFSVFANLPQPNGIIDPIFRIFRTKDGLLWLVGNSRTHQVQPPSSIFRVSKYPRNHDFMAYATKDELLALNGKVYLLSRNQLVPLPEDQGGERIQLELPGGDRDPFATYRTYVNDRDTTIWLLTSKGRSFRVYQFDQQGKKLTEFVPNWKGSLDGMSVLQQITMDREGQLWLALWNQMAIINPANQTGQMIHYDPGSHLPFASEFTLNSCIFADSRNRIWLGHHDRAISWYQPETGETHRYRHDPRGNSSISTAGRVYDINEDVQGNIWVATANGLNKWSPDTETFQRIFERDPSYSERINSVVIDDRQHIWFTANHHLVRYEPDSHSFYTFGQKDGIPVTSFSGWWDLKDNMGRLFFTSADRREGQLYFHPDSVQLDTSLPELILSGLSVNNEPVKVGAQDNLLSKSINFTDRITLKPDQNIFAISYGAIEYRYPDEVRYAVWLKGFHKDWQQVGDKREASFTNLDPGSYTFQVKVQNHHGFWSKTPRSLIIRVLPPWYRTWWAYTLWTVMLLGTIYWFYRFQLNRQLVEAEAQHFKALDQAKSRLYTNITHEFRTPLTVILGMADQMKSDPKSWFNEGLRLIRRNGNQLLNLVNQLLDLSKLESGNLPLKLVQGDIISYLHYLTESFHSYADSKDIRIHFRSDFRELQMDYDPEKMQNILSNLLSNAIKFTPAGGNVYVDVRGKASPPLQPLKAGVRDMGEELLLIISDTGEGIPPEYLPHIFDRFYQVDDSSVRRGEGTGIGLAMVKELVKVMDGHIDVESTPGEGTKFKIRLPVTRSAQEALAAESENDAVPLSGTVFVETGISTKVDGLEPSHRYTVLLVEDNPDVVTYLASVLALQFKIFTAKNGQEGIEKAFEFSPDIIVSDVMMPEKDGFELCQELKADERTSHIPIILLTAKADQRSKIEGLTHGADAYLAKPFHQEELLVRLEKMIELRRRLQDRFQQQGSLLAVLKTSPKTREDLFLQKVIQIIESQMEGENFGMPQLCKELNMSRTNLFRKLKALTGKSTTLLIRKLRLEKAKQLLETTEMNVTEVSFAVGFTSPNYFSRVFQEEFGFRPSEVGKR